MGFLSKKDPLDKTVDRLLNDISGRVSHGFKSFSLDVFINEVGDRRLDDGAVAIANRIQEAGHTVSDIEFISSAKATLTIEAR